MNALAMATVLAATAVWAQTPALDSALANAAEAVEQPADQFVADDLTPAQKIAGERQIIRESTARWWIVGVSTLGIALVERQAIGDHQSVKSVWSQVVYAAPEFGVGKSMMQSLYDCSKRSYRTTRRIDFDPEGRVTEDRQSLQPEKSPVPSTFAEAALNYVCRPGSTMPGPFPLARDEEGAAKVAARLSQMGENGDTAGLLASLDPKEDRTQIEHILTHALRPENSRAARELFNAPPLKPTL